MRMLFKVICLSDEDEIALTGRVENDGSCTINTISDGRIIDMSLPVEASVALCEVAGDTIKAMTIFVERFML